MSAEGWITVGVTVAMVVAMARTRFAPDLVLVAGLTALTAVGIVPLGEAFSGFANVGMLTIAALLVVAAGVRHTGGLDAIMRRVLGRPSSNVAAQLRLILPVASISAFMNNTPVVALMVPVVSDWARPLRPADLAAAHPAQLCLDPRRHVHVDRNEHQPRHLRIAHRS